MILSDRDIKTAIETGEIDISPFHPECVQPASMDVRLANKLLIWNSRHHITAIDPQQEIINDSRLLTKWESDTATFYLQINAFVLGSTLEKITLGDSIVARIEGKSSLARLGVQVHITGGFIDCGFSGNITLEIHNVNPNAIMLTPGMKIAQISFMRLSSSAERPYGHPELNSKYVGENAKGVVGSLYHKNK